MKAYYFDKFGVRVQSDKHYRFRIEEYSSYSYSLFEYNKDSSLAHGDFTRVAAMFERYTTRKLVLDDVYYNAYQMLCDPEWAMFKQSGTSTAIRMGNDWRPVSGMDCLHIYHYDSDHVPCRIAEASESYAITPEGKRYRLKENGDIIEDVALSFTGTRCFLDKAFDACAATDACYRVRVQDNGLLEVCTRSISKWVMHSEVPGFYIREEILTAGMTVAGMHYYDSYYVSCGQADAAFTVVNKVPGVLSKLYEGDKLIKSGTPTDIATYLDERREYLTMPDLEPVPAPELVCEPVSAPVVDGSAEKQHYVFPIINKIWDLCSTTTYFKKEQLYDAIRVMAARNRKLGNGPIFDCRLMDKFNQPLYLIDMEFNTRSDYINFNRLVLVQSLTEANRYLPRLRWLPAPIQWCSSTADLLWNPSIPLDTINQHTLEHVCIDRIDRFPDAFRSTDPTALMLHVKQEVEKAARRAACDISYALPNYSEEHDEVSMLLPIYYPALMGKGIMAVAVMQKTELCYRLKTVITTKMAQRSIGLFTDPANTWLKECV